MNIDKGNQATEGESMIVLGKVGHFGVADEEYRIKTLDNQDRPLNVVTDSQGRVWLIVGTDSGFEGLSAFYFARISYVFIAVEPPNTGSLAPSSRALKGLSILGAALYGLGLAVLVRRHSRKTTPA